MSFIAASATSGLQKFIPYQSHSPTHPALPAESRWSGYTTLVRLASRVQVSIAMTSRFPRPCLTCNQLHKDSGDYCAECRKAREREKENNPKRKAHKAGLYNAEYQRLAKLVRANAVTCHLCNKGYIQGDPWTADHLDAGNPNSPLAPAHRSCNSRRGNKPLT
jgi:hypothetical protein